MLSIDWSYTKGLAIYDGEKVSIVDRKALLKKLAGESSLSLKSKAKINPASLGAEEKSKHRVKSTSQLNPSAPLVILEQGCPLSLIYDILKTGYQVSLIDQFAVRDYRETRGWDKSDENDAIAIYELAQEKPNILSPVSPSDDQVQLVELYQGYRRYQKARVSLQNMRKAYVRQFGDGESNRGFISKTIFNPSPALEGKGESKLNIQSTQRFNPLPHDGTLPYDIGIDTLRAAEKSCLKKIAKLAPPIPQSLKIKGLGPRIWAGIYITANPASFPRLSSYLRYCGLVNLDQLNHKWNRHAKMLYHMLAEEVMRLGSSASPNFRAIYDKCKQDIAEKHSDYTKLHIHNSALNRTATFLAKEMWYNWNQ